CLRLALCFFSSRRRHTRSKRDWSSDVCSSDLGDFPLILMVHGNHTMENFSTDGYDYLGELLASHGFTFISVDEDYANYSNFVGEPNDNYRLRSWLLLKHLTQLKSLN